MPTRYLPLFLISLLLLLAACSPPPGNPVDQGPSPARSPAEEQASFELAAGLRIELVASEPLVQEPVAMTFDADGRLWVVEMRGFMPDLDGTGEDEPLGRVSVLWDTDGDGRMDTSSVFLDSLVLPRAIALVPGGALIAEKLPLWYVEDLDGDLRADRKTLIDSTYGGSGMPEHSGNGLWRGMDNWYYNAKSASRYRLTDGKWVKEETEFRGQWGISHDDLGRLYYNYNWSQLHADLVPPNALSRNPHHAPTTGLDVGVSSLRSIFPIRPTPAVNRGYIAGVLDEQGRMREFTSAGAPLVYRGTALPAAYYGNVFVCEPAGNLIKRNLIDEGPLSLTSHYAWPDREFLASTDERFRPVFLTSGPDGALYVADMYRGIIEHGPYATPYLREQIAARKLAQPIHLGRIWRIVPEDWQAPAPVSRSGASTEALIALLSAADGGLRDLAQRLLVERGERAAVPGLSALAREGSDFRSRLQALWTLEGLGNPSAELYFEALDDAHPQVQVAALRLLEGRAASDPGVRTRLADALVQRWSGADLAVVLQIALSAAVLESSTALPILAGIATKHSDQPLLRDAILSSLKDRELAMLQLLWAQRDWEQESPDRAVLLEMLATAIARKGDPGELQKLEQRFATGDSWRAQAIATGLALIRREQQAAGAPADAARSGWKDADLQRFAAGRQQYLTTCATCHGADGAGTKRLAPPLAGSEWVLGDEQRLVRLVLHGMEGPVEVKGRRYDVPDILPVMPSFTVLDDEALASVLTYLRGAWGHAGAPIPPRTVGFIRHRSQGRVQPWTATELLELSTEGIE